MFLMVFPLCSGYWLWFLVGTNVHDRLRAMQMPTIQEIQYIDEQLPLEAQAENTLQELQQEIIDSLERIVSISYNSLLPPYELRIHRVQRTNLTAYLLHCRLWCDCREDLLPGTFQLIVFQLNPHTSSYALVANTVMTYADYVKPFTLKLP
jgi:hypothetical protein